MRRSSVPSTIPTFADCVIENARRGATLAYLQSAARSEKAMRDACLCMRTHAVRGDGRTAAYDTLRQVNGLYKTRYSLDKIKRVAEIVFASVQGRGWWDTEPPDLLQCSDADADAMTCFVPQTLVQLSSADLNQPYSLLTKWMHFCFPRSFVIYDWRAASSVQEWSYFAFALSDARSELFTVLQMANPDGSGYCGMVAFYRTFWQNITEDQRRVLETAGHDLSKEINSHVSVLDVVDKALWTAAGDPRKMGLLP